MKTRTFLPSLAVLFAALTLPPHTFAQSTNVKAPNTNRSAKFKSIIVRGSGNFIGSNSIASFIGGGQSNIVSIGATNGVIGGGFANVVSNQFGTIGGGLLNTASGSFATIGGGYMNKNSGSFYATIGGGAENTNFGFAATIGGGNFNEVGAYYATVGGGRENTASDNYAFVGGGYQNEAGGDSSCVPGGRQNAATNAFSFAAGRRAKTTAPGQFVWADSQDADFSPNWGLFSSTNTFNVRAKGGVWFQSGTAGANQAVSWIPGLPDWSFTSDAETKENLREIDPREVLQRVASLHITEWSYKGYTQRNIGPMAQDWHAAFPTISVSERQINSSHLQGVSLVAIQGLVEELKERDEAIKELKSELNAVKERLDSLPPAP